MSAGERYGALTVVDLEGRDSIGKQLVRCVCDCGATWVGRLGSLRSGRTRSCGCRWDGSQRRHGRNAEGHPLYAAWHAMRNRCNNPSNAQFPDYGGRGITVWPRWNVFWNFVADVGERPPGKSLDRVDNDGNYEPGNVRWASPEEQRANRRPVVRNRHLEEMTAQRDTWRAVALGAEL